MSESQRQSTSQGSIPVLHRAIS